MKLAKLVQKLKQKQWQEHTANGYTSYLKKDRECRIYWNRGKFEFLRPASQSVPDANQDAEKADVPLTPEQIRNWRDVLCQALGPYALLMSEADLNRVRDNLQKTL